MFVRFFWRGCDLRGGQRGAQPIDAFWVEATAPEAETAVFPCLTAQAVAESRDVAHKFRSLAEHLSNPVRPFCFLTTRDLAAIEPMHVHYPFHQMWNGVSPFEQMPGKEISSLEELKDLTLPAPVPKVVEDVEDEEQV